MRENALAIDKVSVNANTNIVEHGNWQPKWKIEKYDKNMNLYAEEEFEGNAILVDGMNEFLLSALGIGGTSFGNANACIGVGNSTTAVNNGQVTLQGASKDYMTVDPSYPQVSGNTMTFKATFGAGRAVFRWEEFSITNGPLDTSKHLNRLVEYHGEKASLDTWIISCSVTIS